MTAFATDQDRARVCNVLGYRVDLPNLWTAEGPSAKAEGLLLENGGTLSAGQRVLVLLSWVLWKTPLDPTRLKVSELIGALDQENLNLVGSLLVAVSDGPVALEDWLTVNERA